MSVGVQKTVNWAKQQQKKASLTNPAYYKHKYDESN